MADLRELLLFYRDAGVDAALLDAPVDRFAPVARQEPSERREAEAPAPSRPAQRGAAPRERAPQEAEAPSLSVPDEAQAALARQMAASAASLDELRDLLAGFDGCNLKFTATRLVFGDGNPQAPLMVIGEAPGREEDLEGLPFVGRSGRLLDRMLAAIGLDRRSAYITNVIPWRPPGNRAPTPHETEICRPFIERQIELAGPRVILTLGGPATKVLLNAPEGIMRLRGTWRVHTTASGRSIDLMPTLHPAYLLRNPAHKRLAWRDFLEVRVRLQGGE
jgi:DNA polymerase